MDKGKGKGGKCSSGAAKPSPAARQQGVDPTVGQGATGGKPPKRSAEDRRAGYGAAGEVSGYMVRRIFVKKEEKPRKKQVQNKDKKKEEQIRIATFGYPSPDTETYESDTDHPNLAYHTHLWPILAIECGGNFSLF